MRPIVPRGAGDALVRVSDRASASALTLPGGGGSLLAGGRCDSLGGALGRR